MGKRPLTITRRDAQRQRSVIQRSISTLKKSIRLGKRLLGKVSTLRDPYATIIQRNDGSLKLERASFAAGSFREAHNCSVARGSVAGFGEGTKLVLKSMKRAQYKKGRRIERLDFDMQGEVSELAQTFNDEVQPAKNGQSCNIHVVCSKPFIMPEAKHLNGELIVHQGELVALEPFIDGDYEKFNSNNGWSAGNAALPDAFSHWTWVHTNGDILVCDLQGHRGHPGGPTYLNEEYYYLLTDPAIISRVPGKYGLTDMGEKGMREWFSNHKCTPMCRSLGLTDKRPGM